MNKWKIVHDYRRLVNAGTADDLRCPDDSSIYAIKIDSQDEPVLHCFLCPATLTPGAALWQRMKATIDENKEGQR